MQCRAYILIPCIIIATVGTVFIKTNDKPVSFVRLFKVGTLVHYITVSNYNVNGKDVTIHSRQKVRTIEVNKDGSAIYETVSDPSIVMYDGKQQAGEIIKPYIGKRDKFNRHVDIRPDRWDSQYGEFQHVGALTSDVIFCDKQVKRGASWVTEFDNPLFPGKKFNVRTTFIGTSNLNAQAVYKLKQSFVADGITDATRMSGDATFLVDLKSNESLAADEETAGCPSPIGPLRVSLKMHKELQE